MPGQTTWDECLWARNFPDLQRSCYLARVCQYLAPLECSYYVTPAILQAGPTCGLVASSILLNGEPDFKQLLALAQERGFTNHGEMCSAGQLQALLSEVSDRHGHGLLAHAVQGPLATDEIKSRLRDHACLLVPYDADVNHSPFVAQGRKAHWAVVVGHIVDAQGQFFVIARHGKTRNMAVWPLSQLAASNSNLFQFSPPLSNPHLEYKVPPGDLGGPNGLREQAIVVANVQFERIRIH